MTGDILDGAAAVLCGLGEIDHQTPVVDGILNAQVLYDCAGHSIIAAIFPITFMSCFICLFLKFSQKICFYLS